MESQKNSRLELPQPYVALHDDLEERLSEVWQTIMGLDTIEVDDKFFDLGGDSLMAVQLFVEIEQTFGIKMPLSILVKASTISEQANIMRSYDRTVIWSPLVPIQTQGTKKPIYCVSGKGGNPIRFYQFAQRVTSDQPIYFLQSRGISGDETPLEDVLAIAADFLKEIRKIQPHGPYHFLGESSGGTAAYEMAQKLQTQGEKVGLLGMLDTYGPKSSPRFPGENGSLIYALNWTSNLIRKHINTISAGGREGRSAYFYYYWELAKLIIRKGFIYLKEKIERIQYRSFPPELTRVESANIRAVRTYQPQPYPGEVVMFRAIKDIDPDHIDLCNGWGDVGIGEITVHTLDCYHGNILFEPYIGEIAEIIHNHIDNNG